MKLRDFKKWRTATALSKRFAWEELYDSISRALYTCISLKEITERDTDIKVNIKTSLTALDRSLLFVCPITLVLLCNTLMILAMRTEQTASLGANLISSCLV